VGGTLVLDSEGLSKLAAGDARARAHLETAIARRARVVASAMILTEVLRGGPRDAAVHRVLSRITVGRERPVVLLTSDPDDLSRLVEEPERPKAQRITVVRV
jgi:hypothetical protein